MNQITAMKNLLDGSQMNIPLNGTVKYLLERLYPERQ